MTTRFTRKQLYDLIWTERAEVIAKRYATTVPTLRKRCVAADIPIPDRSYWTKFEKGEQVRRLALPARGLGMSDEVVLGEQRDYYRDSDIPDVIVAPVFDEPMDVVANRIQKLVDAISFYKSHQPRHPRIKLFMENHRAYVADKRNERRYSYSRRPDYDSKFERRRLKILDSLFVALQALGGQPSIKGLSGRDLQVKVGDTIVQFTLDSVHAARQLEQERYGYNFEPRGETDDLKLVAESDKSWSDKKDTRTESDLPNIAFTLIVMGEQKYRDQCERLYDNMVHRRAEKEKAERQRLINEENKRLEHIRIREQHCFDKLVAQASAHKQAGEIRQWIEVVRSSVGELAEVSGASKWCAWAHEFADRIDPLVSNLELDWPGKSGPLR